MCACVCVRRRTVGGQDDCDVLLTEGADAQQHGGPLGGEEAEGHVLPGSAALSGHAGGLRAPVLHDREGLLEGVGDRGLAVKGHRHLWRTATQGEGEEEGRRGGERKERGRGEERGEEGGRGSSFSQSEVS